MIILVWIVYLISGFLMGWNLATRRWWLAGLWLIAAILSGYLI